MTKRIFLHGHLAELYPEPIEVEADTIAEALMVLQQLPKLAREDGQPHPVTVKGVDSDVALFAETTLEEIHVYPRLGGAGGRGGLSQILLGVVLVAVSFIVPAAGLAGGLITKGSLALFGSSLILGGILQMLTPMPEEQGEQQSSNFLGASANTVRIGTNITLAYGNVKLGGHYLSFDVDSKNQAGTSAVATGVISDVPVGEESDITITDSVYRLYDRTPVVPVPVNPVFAEPIASPTNIPTSAWNQAA